MLDPVYAYSTRKMVVRGYEPVELALVGEALENGILPPKLVRKYIDGMWDDEHNTDDTDDGEGAQAEDENDDENSDPPAGNSESRYFDLNGGLYGAAEI